MTEDIMDDEQWPTAYTGDKMTQLQLRCHGCEWKLTRGYIVYRNDYVKELTPKHVSFGGLLTHYPLCTGYETFDTYVEARNYFNEIVAKYSMHIDNRYEFTDGVEDFVNNKVTSTESKESDSK